MAGGNHDTPAAARLDAFETYRGRMNARISELQHLGINRFLALDSRAYDDSALDGKTKELIGLVASLVLRCDDCVDYHLLQCAEAGWNEAEIVDAMNVGLVVGGSIVIPHLRHAIDSLDAIMTRQDPQP